MRNIILFSKSSTVIAQWRVALKEEKIELVATLSELEAVLNAKDKQIVLYDDDSLEYQIEEVMQVVNAVSDTRLFVLSGDPSFEKGVEYLTYQISGYGNSHMHYDNLKVALDVIESGNVWLYPEFVRALISGVDKEKKVPKAKHKNLELLTAKEHAVADLVAQGLSNKMIAQKMGITERTVKAHLTHIFEKLAISDRLSLALIIKV